MSYVVGWLVVVSLGAVALGMQSSTSGARPFSGLLRLPTSLHSAWKRRSSGKHKQPPEDPAVWAARGLSESGYEEWESSS